MAIMSVVSTYSSVAPFPISASLGECHAGWFRNLPILYQDPSKEDSLLAEWGKAPTYFQHILDAAALLGKITLIVREIGSQSPLICLL